ncbi:hypothetical protein ILP92_16260 [Maribius pontilimi]|uniref:ATPase BadF/BadG/BcrA/BcrD type domain-containing protein n=1 Tax=Palleronia pontilimi TaxID=1964209 RepID=A0A934IBX8_9RHOB|nr:BadF/BadG/BcrA/BcrD ATPase family protein [Palleronia pontilimi]MBJ3764304.1 hypothetical protein [Palleronia pontilimi]
MSIAKDAHLIGVDGGGSGCRVSIRAASGAEIGSAEAGPANATTDLFQSIANVLSALHAACAMAGLSGEDLRRSHVHAGLAGVVSPGVATAVARGMMKDTTFASCSVSDDREIQALGALGGSDGYLLAIGTGSIVARLRDGRLTGLGGWGFVLSDQGSGGDLGRRALSRTLQAHDGLVERTALSDELLARFDGPAGIAAWAARATPADFAKLAPDITRAAGKADPMALDLMIDGAAYFDRALRVLGFTRGDRLCLTGGLGPNYESWLVSAAGAELTRPRGSALDGAILLAARRGRSGR